VNALIKAFQTSVQHKAGSLTFEAVSLELKVRGRRECVLILKMIIFLEVKIE